MRGEEGGGECMVSGGVEGGNYIFEQAPGGLDAQYQGLESENDAAAVRE